MSYFSRNTWAVQRVLSAPGLVLTVIAFHLSLAFLISQSVRTAAGASMGRFAVVSDGQLLLEIIELLGNNPGIAGSFTTLFMGSWFFGLLFWMLLAGGVIHRLAAPAPASHVASRAVRFFPSMLVITIWHLILRAVLLGLALFAVRKLEDTAGVVALIVAVAIFFYCICALDLARVNTVLHGGRRFHFRTAWRGYVQAAKSPRVLLPSMFLSLCQWAVVIGIVFLAGYNVGNDNVVWMARGLSAVGVLLGLTRIAVAVGAGRPARP